MADTSNGRLAYVKELTPGSTPTTPAFKTFDFTNESLALSKNNIRSNTVASSRVVKSSRATSAQTGGSINFEMTKAAELEQLLESLAGNAWASNVLKMGGTVVDTYTIERALAVGSMYRRFVGSRIGSLDLTIQPEQFISGAFGIVGSAEASATAAIAGSTYAAAATAAKLTSLDTLAVTATGIAGTFDYAQLSLKIDNNLSPSKRLGGTPTRKVRAGQCVVTGELQLFVEDNAWNDAYLAETPFALTVQLRNASLGYDFTMPVCAITSYSDPNTGNGGEFIATVGFEATFDASSSTSLSITRV